MGNIPTASRTCPRSASRLPTQPTVPGWPSVVRMSPCPRPWRSTSLCSPRMRSCSRSSNSTSSQQPSHTLPRPCPSSQPSQALAQSCASAGSTPCTRWIACRGSRLWPHIVASSSVRKQPGAHAGGRLGRRWAPHTAHGPVLKPPRCAYAGMSPGKPPWPGGRKSLTQAQP